MNRHRKSEYGQVVILLAVGIVGLLGFTALAIDGGLVYSERRHAQNAADTATMAAALAKINNDPYWEDVALSVAATNGYNNDGATNVVTVHSPPISGPFAGQPNHVQTIIQAQVDTFLVHFVYQGIVENTVDAVVDYILQSSGPMYAGNALVGLNPTACDTVRAGGTSGTDIIGGGVFVNSNHPDCAFRRHGVGELNVDGPIDVVGGWANNGPSGLIDPIPTTGATQVPYPPDPDIDPPVCSGDAIVVGDQILPGNYSGEKFPPEGVTKFGDPLDLDEITGELRPQIFCIDVTDKFHLGPGNFEGDGVLFYMKNGNVEWNANAQIDLSPPTNGDYAGLLIHVDPHGYVDPPNTWVTINGGVGSRVTGTIWGPASHCKLNGNGDTDSWRLQVICYNIELLGNAKLYINYDDSDVFHTSHPARLSMSQ
jgi:hypothetical protein